MLASITLPFVPLRQDHSLTLELAVFSYAGSQLASEILPNLLPSVLELRLRTGPCPACYMRYHSLNHLSSS